MAHAIQREPDSGDAGVKKQLWKLKIYYFLNLEYIFLWLNIWNLN